MIKYLIPLAALFTIIYSCTVTNRAAYGTDYPVIITKNLMAIGDTLVHKNLPDSINSASMQAVLDPELGRKVIYRNHAELAELTRNGSGKIFIKLGIDRKGNVVYTEIDQINTTFTDKEILSKALNMLMGYEFESDPMAPEFQYGTIKLYLNLDNFR